jgi:aspartate racemase
MKENNEKLLGVMGGMGPLATQLFYRMIIDKNDAHCDQDHLNMIIFNHASMPDRTKAILKNETEDLYAKLLADAKLLEELGVDYIAIPCNTSHYFVDRIQEKIGVPIINMIIETIGEIDKEVTKVGILATDGTIKTGLYQKACKKAGFIPVIPSEECQKLIMKIIYDGVKDGGKIEISDFETIDKQLKDEGCNCAIMACTELSCFKEAYHIGDYYMDAMNILAKKSLEYCGKKLKV